ncbi:hypothetical protein [Sphingomonas sp.]|uniref:hypothetical protein n=1 Tax=Sphingomonas sp. TaxID=28214 RepID=UPI0031E0D44D
MTIWIPLIAFAVQLAIFARFLSRFGFSPVWAATAIVPLLPLIALWIIAFTEWPIPDRREQAAMDEDELTRDFS